MKKLMMAAAIVCAAAANAASVDWGSGNVYVGDPVKGSELADDTGTAVADGTTMYYVFSQIDESDYDTWCTWSQDAKYKAFTANGASSTVKIGDNSYTALAAKSLVDGLASVQETGYSKGDYAYGLSIITYDPDKDGKVDFFSASEASGKCTTSGKNLSGMPLYNNAGENTTWQATAVPEPFSGALALLGMGAIALRRKMKKAKKA